MDQVVALFHINQVSRITLDDLQTSTSIV